MRNPIATLLLIVLASLNSTSLAQSTPGANDSTVVAPKVSPRGGTQNSPEKTEKTSKPPTVAWIPLTGAVGLDLSEKSFSAASFKRCTERVRQSGCKTLVLEIESKGGRVDTKEQVIQEILRLSAEGVRTIALVRDAGSAAALITIACTDIYVMPAARIGAAVMIVHGESGVISMKKILEDDPELEAKFRSFGSAIDEEAARATNRCPCITKAMKEKDAVLWHSPTSGFSETKSAPDALMIDSEKDVLTLTYTQMLDTRFAKGASSAEQLLQELGADKEQVLRLDNEIQSDNRKLDDLLENFGRQQKALKEYLAKTKDGSNRGGAGSDRGKNREADASRAKSKASKEQKVKDALQDVVDLLRTP